MFHVLFLALTMFKSIVRAKNNDFSVECKAILQIVCLVPTTLQADREYRTGDFSRHVVSNFYL